MANYIGSAKEVDHYIGNNLVVAKYIGENKYFDAYSEIEGNLPLTFKARVAHALTDYRIYGTENGAGVQTENLFDKDAKDVNNGFIDNAYISTNGEIVSDNNYYISEFMPIPSSSYIAMDLGGSIFPTTISLALYNDNKQYIAYSAYSNNRYKSLYAGSSATFCRISVKKNYQDNVVFEIGSTAPTSYIPYGYELPLTVESGEQSSDYDLYIGDTKLGAEEYVDYGEQKVWKRTENLFDKSTAILGKEIQGNSIVDNANWAITPLIPVEPQSYYSTLSFGVARLEYMSENDNNPIRTVASSQNPTLSTTHFIRLNVAISNLTTATLVSGSTSPDHYVPYLQPTNPPAPLPAISTYKGENTLSSTETVGDVSVTGKIKEADPLPEMAGIKAVFEYGGLSGTTWKNKVGSNNFTWTSGNEPTDNGTEYVLSGNTFAKAGQYDSSDDYSGAVTMYLLAKFEEVKNGYALVVGGLESGYTYGIDIYASNTYGDYATASNGAEDLINPAVPANEYHVIAVTAASSDYRITVYGDGIKQLHTTPKTRLPRNYNGKAALYGMLPSGSSAGNMHVKFMAFGNEKHTEEQIVANSQFIMSKYGIS